MEHTIETTKQNVSLIAPELLNQIYGVSQKTRVYILDITSNNLTIDDKEYIYEVQSEDTIQDVIDGLIELIENDEDSIVEVVNTQSNYFDLVGILKESFTVSQPVSENLQTAVSPYLWDLFAEDIVNIVNEDTFVAEIERAQRYLMAHLLTLSKMLQNLSGASSEKVGDVSITYADPLSSEGLASTGYGLIYKGIYLKQRKVRYIPASLKNFC